MQNKYNESTPQRPEGKRSIDAPIVKFDLEASLTQIRTEKTYLENDRNAITLFKSEQLRCVLIAMKQGAEMKTHTTDGISSLQVLDGEIRFHVGENYLDVSKSEVITIHEGVPHGVLALKETAFLLTMVMKVQRDG